MTPVEALNNALGQYPRISLGNYPTPLELLPRLSAALNRDVYLKRDDEIGPGMGGNKTRKLEYLLAPSKKFWGRKVVTFGGLQSNHARLTAAAARKCGLEPHLFYFSKRPRVLKGNLQLNELLGARMHFIPFGGGGDGTMTLETTNLLVRLVALLRLGPHLFLPVGGHSWRGCLGYVRAAIEIHKQAQALNLKDPWVITAAGTGGTLAGLMAGFNLLSSSIRPLGIDIGKLWKSFPKSIAHLATELCRRLGSEATFRPEEVPLIEDAYAGEAYAKTTPASLAVIRRLAQREGVLLDPVYTGKAFAGMLDLAARGRLGKQTPLIFLHTGGYPALFAYEKEVLSNG